MKVYRNTSAAWIGLAILAVFFVGLSIRTPSPWEYFIAGLLGGGNLGLWAGRSDGE